MSDLTDRARLMAEESDDWSIIRQLADRVDYLERDQERNLTDLADGFKKATAAGWDAAVSAMRYEDGTPVQVAVNDNPYRSAA